MLLMDCAADWDVFFGGSPFGHPSYGELNDDIIRMIENADSYDELVLEHLKKLGEKLAHELEEIAGLDAGDVKASYEKVLEEMERLSRTQGNIEAKFDESLEKFLKVLPDSATAECN